MMPFPPPISRDRIIAEFPKVHPVCYLLQFDPDSGKTPVFYCEITVVKMAKKASRDDVKFIGNVGLRPISV